MKDYIWPKITKDTSIEELKRIHQQIWDYVIEHWIKPYNTGYMHSCVACEYAATYVKSYDVITVVDDSDNEYKVNNFCAHCPIKWPNNTLCPSDYSPFRKWMSSVDKDDNAMDFAKQIRDVEWKGENKDGTNG